MPPQQPTLAVVVFWEYTTPFILSFSGPPVLSLSKGTDLLLRVLRTFVVSSFFLPAPKKNLDLHNFHPIYPKTIDSASQLVTMSASVYISL